MVSATETVMDMLMLASCEWGAHPKLLLLPPAHFWCLVAEAEATAKPVRKPGCRLVPVSMPDGSLVEVEWRASVRLAGPCGYVTVRPELPEGVAPVLLADATDEQLRAECERRGNGLVMPGGWSWSKAVMGCPKTILEEELARRGVVVASDTEDIRWLGLKDERIKLVAERDDWKHQAQAALASANNCATARDEWKRRAERRGRCSPTFRAATPPRRSRSETCA